MSLFPLLFYTVNLSKIYAHLTGLTSVSEPVSAPDTLDPGGSLSNKSGSFGPMKWPRLGSQGGVQIHGCESEAVTTEISGAPPSRGQDPTIVNQILWAVGWRSDRRRNSRFSREQANIARSGSFSGQRRSSNNARKANYIETDDTSPDGITISYEVRRTEEEAEV